jgi:hypothetical protein
MDLLTIAKSGGTTEQDTAIVETALDRETGTSSRVDRERP